MIIKKNTVMKKVLTIIGFVWIAIAANAQTAIEKRTVSSPSTLLDFASGTTKGIILPAVETMPTTPANGTFLFDKAAQIVKMYQNGVWVSLSEAGDATKVAPYSGTVDNGKQTIIGSRTTKVVDGTGNYVDGAVNGVLILESPNKAMVLPKVASPHANIKSPLAGTMCYDTDRKALAVFDGKVWNYWK